MNYAALNTSIFSVLLLIITVNFISCSGERKPVNQNQGVVTQDPLAELSERIRNDSTDHQAFAQRAELYLGTSAINKALADINKALQIKPNHGPYLLILSDLYFAMGETQKCREIILKALDVDEYDTDAMMKMAEFGLYYKDYDLLKRYADRALSVSPGLARAHFILGFAAKEQGDTALAIQQFRWAVDGERDFYEAYVQLGILHAAQGDTLAEAYYKSALRVKPGSLEALYNLGLHYQESERYNEAFDVYNQIISLEPGFKQAYYNIGYIHLVYLSVYDVAASYFDKAIQADPGYVEAYYNRGYSLEMAGDVLGARRDYQKALQLRSNYPMAIEGLNRLDRIDRQMQR